MKPNAAIDACIAAERDELRQALLKLRERVESELTVLQTSGCLSVQADELTVWALVARSRNARIGALENARSTDLRMRQRKP